MARRRFSNRRRSRSSGGSRRRGRSFGRAASRGSQTVRLVIQQAPQQAMPGFAGAVATPDGLAALTPFQAKGKARF